MKKSLLAVLACMLCICMILPSCTGQQPVENGTGPDTSPAPDGQTNPQGDTEPTESGPQSETAATVDTPTEPADQTGSVPETETDAEPDAEPDTESDTEPETLPPDLENVPLSFDETFICLKKGDTVAVGSNVSEDRYAEIRQDILYASGDTVAQYENGTVTALGGGCCRLTAYNRYTGVEASLTVRVIDRENDETCIIGAPIWDYRFMDETQMKYIADAGFNAIFMSTAPDRDIIDFMTMAEPYSLKVYPYLATDSADELSMSDRIIKARIDKFRQYPAFGGFNLRDEPSYYFNEYARVAQLIYDYDPSLTAMINFLPNAERSTVYNYGARLHDDDYRGVLSFDNYIFPPSPGSVNETWLFRNFELYRQAGIDNRCKTAFYLQSIGSGTYGYRRPDEGTMFYHAMVSLAYGCTMMRYFSYVTPNTYEYTSGVIDIDGNPTDLYDVTCRLNEKYASYGLWLVHANADEVFHTGSKLDSGADYRIVPDSYWITPADEAQAGKRTVLTTFTDRYTGQNYLMIVNKDFENEVTVTYRLSDVPYLCEVDAKTGLLTRMDLTDGILEVTLPRGDGRLFVLPYGKTYTTPGAASDNLFSDAYITVSSVSDSAGSCAEYLCDGLTLSGEDRLGWRASQDSDGAWIKAEFDGPTSFNRLDLYPAGNGAGSGRFFPSVTELLISDDGMEWRTVVTVPKSDDRTVGLSVTFETVTARFVMLSMPELYKVGDNYQCELAEICLFNDDGRISPVGKTDYEPLAVPAGTNVALGKKCCDYSSVQNTFEWHEHEIYLTDGDNSQKDYYAYSSAACRNGSSRAHEYFILDLENTYPINKIVLYPNFDGTGFPSAYTLEVSPDGRNWTVVKEVKTGRNSGEVVTVEFDTLDVAFIKLDATVLTLEANPAALYVLQIAELEAYTSDR